VLQNLSTASVDPAVTRLPHNIQRDLLNPANQSLRDQLRPRPTKSPYAPSDLHKTDISPQVRAGPFVDEKAPLSLSKLERHFLSRACGFSFAQMPDTVARLKNLILPNRPSRSGTIYADLVHKGVAHYTVDATLDQKCTGIVQVEDLFVFNSVGYARVTWGKKGHADAETGFYTYNFQEPTPSELKKAELSLQLQTTVLLKCERLVRAERLIEYVYFGHVYATGKPVFMLLNTFHIPH
jgi:hypothetical protein